MGFEKKLFLMTVIIHILTRFYFRNIEIQLLLMEEDSPAVDREVDSQGGHLTRRRRGSPDQIDRFGKQGSPNRNQPMVSDKTLKCS